MAAWLSAMVSDRKVGRQLKLDTARRWWMFGLAFYAAMGVAAVYAALTESGTAARGLATIEGTLLVLLMFETLMHRVTRHIVSELPMAGDVVADCLRLIARLYAVILIADALMVRVLGAVIRRGMGGARPRRQDRSDLPWWRSTPSGGSCATAWIPTSPPTRCRRPTPAANSEDEVRVAASRLRHPDAAVARR